MVMSYFLRSLAKRPAKTLLLAYPTGGFHQIDHYLDKGEATAGAQRALEESFLRLQKRMSSHLEATVCLGLFEICCSNEGEDSVGTPALIRCAGKYFSGAIMAAFIVATLGKSAEEECSRLYKRGEYIDALVLDAMASAALDGAVRETRERLRKEFKDVRIGFSLPKRQAIPPGSQRAIFDLLMTEKTIGVKLTESMLLIPLKSTSVIVPIGKSISKRA